VHPTRPAIPEAERIASLSPALLASADGYYAAVKASERAAREELAGGRRHVYEAEMKERERTRGLRHHEARPYEGPPRG
jgi:hypothetical protein